MTPGHDGVTIPDLTRDALLPPPPPGRRPERTGQRSNVRRSTTEYENGAVMRRTSRFIRIRRSPDHHVTTPRTRRATRAAAAIAAGVLAVSLTACGGDDDNGGDNDKDGGTADTGTTVTLPELDGETLEVAAVWTGAEQANFKKVLA